MSSVVYSKVFSALFPNSRSIAANLDQDATKSILIAGIGPGPILEPDEVCPQAYNLLQKALAPEAQKTPNQSMCTPRTSIMGAELWAPFEKLHRPPPWTTQSGAWQTSLRGVARGIPDVSIHLPFDRVPPKPRRIKIKLLQEFFPEEMRHSMQWATIYDARGRAFVTSKTMLRGTSGKIRWAVEPHLPHAGKPYGDILAVKELRHAQSRQHQRGTGKTVLTTHRAAEHEVKMTLQLRRAIDDRCSFYSQLPLSDPNSLRRARTDETPFKLHGFFYNSDRSYIIMNKDLGTAGSLLPQVSSTIRAFALASLWAQMLTELHALHSEGYLHGDLSSNNVFCTATGQFKLMDFGRAKSLASMGSRRQRLRGTYIAPEEVLSELVQGPDPMHWATEVFAAGALLASVSCQAWHNSKGCGSSSKTIGANNIFIHSYRSHPMATMTESFCARFDAMTQWLGQVTHQATGRISPELILAGPKNDIFNQFFAPLAHDHPRLCEMVLSDALAVLPQKRLATDVLAQKARMLLPQDTMQRDEFIAVLKRLEDLGRPEQMYWQAMMYFDTQQHWSHI